MTTAGGAAVVRRCTVCRTPYGVDERFCPRDGGAIVVDGDADDPLVGTTIGGRYFVRRPIGRGGMGVVYEADHVGLDKRVAIKLILERYATDREAVTRFHREARNASRIGHPAIAMVTDIGDTDDGRSFLVMELLEGADLGQVLRAEGAMAPARAVAIVRQILGGLAAAHDAGIVHRDMKPENVFLTGRGDERDVVKIMDFGISKVVAARDANLRLTDTGAVVGTPIYMAPEQAMGSPDVDHRVDLYAVGVMLYELLSGRPPFTGASYLALVSQHLNEPPPPLRRVAPAVPVTLAAVVHKALEKSPDQRFADARDFARALPAVAELAEADATGGGVAAAQAGARRAASGVAATVKAGAAASVSQRTTAWRDGSRRWPVALAGGALLAAVGVAAWWTTRDREPTATASSSAPRPSPEPSPRPSTSPSPSAPPSTTPLTTGILELDSSPRGARVFLDGALRGTTPLRIDPIDVGEHEIRLEADGHVAAAATKDVRAGYVESFYAVLAPASAPRERDRDRDRDRRPEREPEEDPTADVKRDPPRTDPPRPADRTEDERKPNPYIDQ